MDAIQFIKQEHTKAKAAFSKLLEAAPAKRDAMWNELKPELKAHEEIEDACLYGPLLDEGPADAKILDWVSDKHSDEVEKVENLIEKTESLDSKDVGWLTIVKEIHSALEQHILQEEGEIFPRIAKVWDHDKLEQAGEEMIEMKAEKSGRR
jgi:iron-sulfur cluster repair protein YtfE (RIC family)